MTHTTCSSLSESQLHIPVLGEACIPSPLHYCGMEKNTYINLCLNQEQTEDLGSSSMLSLELAGPRSMLYFDPPKTRCAIVTCGGLCPGLNDVIRSIVLEAHYAYQVSSVVGIRYGLEGFIPKFNHATIELTPEVVKNIYWLGGTMLGSSRGPQQPKEIVDALTSLNIDILFVIGGDGSMKAANAISTEIQQRNLSISIIGIPKTIDNDINFIPKSFGFDTAVEKATEAIGCAHVEAIGAKNGIGIVKVMGRESGFIAAQAALALRESNFVLIPEVPFQLYGHGGLLPALEERLLTRSHAVILAAEGAGQHLLDVQKEKDPSGNPILADIGSLLKTSIKNYFAKKSIPITIKYIDPSYIIRSVVANANDRVYCGFLGQHAVHAAMAGKTRMVVANIMDNYVHVPLDLVIKNVVNLIQIQVFGELYLNLLVKVHLQECFLIVKLQPKIMSRNSLPSTTSISPLRQIRASAGSGKTYELTSSFLSFLANITSDHNIISCQANSYNHSWLSILAITFTNRAATEMQERIINRLKDTALGIYKAEPYWTAQKACRWLNVLLHNYGSLNICTIDSLLHTIVRLTALELKLPPDFQPVFSIEDALTPLLDAMLENTKYNSKTYAILHDVCKDLFFHTSNNGFMVGNTLRKKVLLTILPLMNYSSQIAQPEEIAAQLQVYMVDLKNTAKELTYCIKNEQLLLHTHFTTALELCLSGNTNSIPPPSVMLRKACLTECLLKSSKNIPSNNTLALYDKLRTLVEQLDTKGTLLKKALSIVPYIRLAKEAQTLLPDFFRQQGVIPASLIPSLVQQALSGEYGVSGAFCKLGTNLHHILIDEFQDTSHEQWNAIHPLIIEALSHGGSLTWVGDVKQAIYSWRGGDANLFEDILSDPELKAIAPTAQKDLLPTNWRSARTIVTTNNSIFSKISEQPIAQQILSTMLPKDLHPTVKESILSEHIHSATQHFSDAGQFLSPGKVDGYVFFKKIQSNTQQELDSLVLDQLITLIHEICSRRPLSDITILVRSNKRATQVATWLIDNNIAVITENSFLLIEHPLIIQLVALLEFLDSPRNDLAFWTVIAGGSLIQPLIQITQQQLDEWICTRNRTQPLYIAFKQDFPHIWDYWLASFHADAGLLSPYDAIQEALTRLHIQQRFLSEMPFIRRFLEVIHTASIKGYGSISTFLNHWKLHGHEEKTPMPENLTAVRIMTIHKSKGLQFPVVIIPWHDFSPQPDTSLIQTCVDGLEILVNQSSVMTKEYYSSIVKNTREALHLLYVAWTRAEEELYALLTTTISKKITFFEAIIPLIDHLSWKDDTYEAGIKPYSTVKKELLLPTEERAHDTYLMSAPDDTTWRPMHWLPQLRIFRSPLKELGITGKRRGILLHYCLQYLRLSGEPSKDAEFAFRHGIKRFPLPLESSQYHVIKTELIDILTWYAALPCVSHWLQFGVPEQPIIDKENNVYRADLIVNDGKECSIIEYKTGEPLLLHKKQIQKYIEITKETTKLPVKGYTVYFDHKEIVIFSE